MAVTQIFGARVNRREDPRLIRGRARYTDNLTLPNLAYAAILRSPQAHARIRSIDVSQAREAPGVVAVFTGKDLEGKLQPIPCAWLIPGSDLKTPPHPALAADTVRYQGDAVALVVADDRYRARDALELVDVDYEPLEAVTNPRAATQDGVLGLHADVPNNIAFRWKLVGGDVEQAFAEAEVTIRQEIVNNRLIPNAMEPRAAMARFDPGSGELTLWSTSQNPHIARILLSGVLGHPEHKLRVVSTDVGGGFGSKIPFYADEALVAFAAKELGRPVKWVEERSENYLATIHGRDHVAILEAAAKRDGTITAIREVCYANLGAYLSTAAPGIPTILHGLIMAGPYTVPNVSCEVIGVFTNTTPVDAYRGAGRPEATYAVERLVDLVARELGMDPVEVRRHNLIPADRFPYTAATGLQYDSGNYQAALDRALEMLDYPAFRREQEEARREGRYLGAGFSTYVEICGLGPSPAVGATGFQGGLWESAVVRVHPTAKVDVYVGTNPHGQGEETTFAQIVSSELGIPIEDVDIHHGDTQDTPMGWGTYGSRTTTVGGAAVALACRKVADKARALTAHLLEAAEEDIEFREGKFWVRGSPDKARTFQEVTLQAYLAWNLPQGMEPGLEASAFFDPVNFVFPFGAHVCTVEVEPETGAVKVRRYIAVDDCGRIINPQIVEGQVHGGITQGMAQALWEEAVYDEAGNLLTGSLMDYAVPRADMVPRFETDHTETPSPHNPIGVKGVGETGTIAASAAVVNAVCDALAPLGIKHIDMPLKPEKVWRAIQAAQSAGGASGDTGPTQTAGPTHTGRPTHTAAGGA